MKNHKLITLTSGIPVKPSYSQKKKKKKKKKKKVPSTTVSYFHNSNMSNLRHTIKATTAAFIKSYVDAGQAKQPHLLSTSVAENCVRYIGPVYFLRSVGAPADFSMSNAEYEADFGEMAFYTIDTHEMYDLTIDTENLKAALRSELFGTLVDGKEFSRTFVWFLDFNEDGSKIIKVYQHNDSEEGRNFRLTVKALKEAENQLSE
jgi:hypothetical protein